MQSKNGQGYFGLDIKDKIRYWENYITNLTNFVEDESYFGRLSQDAYHNIIAEIERAKTILNYVEKEYLAQSEIFVHKTYKSGESLFKPPTKHPDPNIQKIIENEDPNKYNPK